MSCAHPLRVKPTFSVKGRYYSAPYYSYVPCGYCLNCRRDLQNYIIDRANYEYCKRLTAAFVTFTYNDSWLIDRCSVRDVDGSFIYEEDGSVRTSLNYKDLQKFLHSIREYIKEHPEIQNVLCQPDFSYLYVGEYGDCFGRCHFHVLFFGLDFAYCKKIIFERWKYGFVDVLPLLDGGVRYVCKYMDKFEKGEVAEYKFDYKGIARPKLRMSIGFGQDLLWDNAKDIVDHFYTYKVKNTRRPISAYWKFLLTGGLVSRDVTKDAWNKPNAYYKEMCRQNTEYEMRQYHLKDCRSDEAQRQFRLKKARIREENLKIQLRNDQHPCYDDFSKVVRSKFGFITYDHKRIRRLPTAQQKLLAEEYRHCLEEDYLYEKFPDKAG